MQETDHFQISIRSILLLTVTVAAVIPLFTAIPIPLSRGRVWIVIMLTSSAVSGASIGFDLKKEFDGAMRGAMVGIGMLLLIVFLSR
jgi:hypothetical protein